MDLSRVVGTYTFVFGQVIAVIAYICFNTLSAHPFDPFPFVFLNLSLSLQAAFLGPLILRAQTKAHDKDIEDLKAHTALLNSIHEKLRAPEYSDEEIEEFFESHRSSGPLN